MSQKRKWVGRIYTGRDEHGKQTFEWVGRYATRRERDNAVAERRVQLMHGIKETLPTVDEYVERYLREYERTHKGSSHGTAADSLKHFRRDFAGRRLDIPRAEAKDWANGDGAWKTRGPVPAGAVHSVVTLYNHAISEDDLPLDRNPFRNLGQRSKGRSEQPPPTEEEFRRLLEA